MTKEKRDNRFAYLVSLPLIIYLLLILFVPMVKGLGLSFTNKMIGGEARFIGLKNYINILSDPQFWSSLKITIGFTAISIACKALLGLAMALILNVKFKGRAIARALMLIPWTLPNVVAVLNWRWIFSDIGGVANSILRTIGLTDQNLIWFGSAGLAFLCAVIVNVWRGVPFFGISLLSHMQTIPADYYEAADIDGANAWGKFWHITFPEISGVLSLSALMSTIWTLNEFETIWLLTGGGPNQSTEVINVYSYRTAMTSMQLGKGISVAVLLMPLLLVMIVLISRRMFAKERY